MSKKIKNLCFTFALAAAVGISASASACTVQSKHPNAKISVSFNSKIYEIEYTLYRNMYPQTVQHFIELADAGFYNDVIIHNYSSADWITGAYSYDSSDTVGYEASYASSGNDSGRMVEYLEDNCKEKAYYELVGEGIKSGAFSASVYSKSIYNTKGEEIVSVDDALPTLIGEFSENGHKIDGDKGLTASYGSLKMMYYEKDTKQNVVVNNSFNQILPRDYRNNCATSLFSMQVANSSKYDANKYCVFGQLKNDGAKTALEDLMDAINDYASLSSTSKFTTTVAAQVDKEDKFAGDGGKEIEESFTLISMPLIIRSVEITKY